MKAVITVGISASGKTYWASQQKAVDVNRDWIRFNVIAPGSDWGSYKFNKAKENEVTKIQEQMEGRSPFAWDKVGTDSVKEIIKAMAIGYDRQGYLIICVSGRDGVCYDETQLWLHRNEIPHWYLFMREEGDMRKDTIIKEEIFWNKIANDYNVVGVVDDRPSVVRMWHELKIPNVICVGNPWVEF